MKRDAFPHWPSEAFDAPPALQTIAVPPNGEQRLVCAQWPECGCEANCDAVAAAGGVLRAGDWIALGLAIATALVGIGLIAWSFAP